MTSESTTTALNASIQDPFTTSPNQLSAAGLAPTIFAKSEDGSPITGGVIAAMALGGIAGIGLTILAGWVIVRKVLFKVTSDPIEKFEAEDATGVVPMEPKRADSIDDEEAPIQSLVSAKKVGQSTLERSEEIMRADSIDDEEAPIQSPKLSRNESPKLPEADTPTLFQLNN
jgi:hypothetical protein